MKRRDLLSFTASVSALSLMSARVDAAKLGVGDGDVFVVIDVQNCFVPGGSLAVKGADEIVSLVNTQGSLAKAWTDMNSAGVQRIQSSDLL